MLTLARLTGLPICHVLGIMVSFWCWVSDETVDGHVDADVDALASLFGTDSDFWRRVIQVGWLKASADEPSRLVVPNFDHWLSNGAKARLQKTRRQKRYRGAKANVDAPASTSASTQRLPEKRREEKRREEKKNKKEMSTSLAQAIYLAYPRHVGKAKALPAIEKAIELIAIRNGWMKKDAAAWLLKRVQEFAASPLGQLDTKPDTPYPATWFSGKHGGRFDDGDGEWLKVWGEAASPARIRGTDTSDAQLNISRPTT